MTREETRRNNARALAKEAGSLTAFAKAMDMSDSQINQIIGKNPLKNIGNIIAARIEEKFSKPKGWLDTDHSVESRAEKMKSPRKAGASQISGEAMEVAKAFDLLKNAAQKEAVFSQLRAFGVLD